VSRLCCRHHLPHPHASASAVALQAKKLGSKLKLQRGEDDSEDEEDGPKSRGARGKTGEEEEQGAGRLAWGANKRAYYDADEPVSAEDIGRGMWHGEKR
jgi:hypothetical protein